jgi:hypothetical protein
MIFHAYSEYTPKNPDTVRRMALAKRTWDIQPWNDLPIPEKEGRLFHDKSGQVPYIKDIFSFATQLKADEDIIVFTNSDICVSGNCCVTIVPALQSLDAIYCFRRDFGRMENPLSIPRIRSGTHYVGSDLYAFRVGWWREYRGEFPDMLLGRECWDAVMRLLIDMTHTGRNPTLYDLIYHERHSSVWENPSNKRSLPSQLHNIDLARKWLLSYGFNPKIICI